MCERESVCLRERERERERERDRERDRQTDRQTTGWGITLVHWTFKNIFGLELLSGREPETD